jgi:hypothetical protein
MTGVIAGILLLAGDQAPSTPQIDLKEARQAFALARELWEADGGKLWGVTLEAPMMFVEPRSRMAVANRSDDEGHLRAEGDLFVGKLPNNVPVANFSYKWSGVTWIMLVWPLPENRNDRAVLLMHESWHGIQSKLKLPPTNPRNAHLDTFDGRYWLQLEWNALRAALTAEGDARKAALRDALLFRSVRRARFPEARVDEGLLEMHEGLANYTGVALSGMSKEEQRKYLVEYLAKQPAVKPSFTRSFAYLSGPAYGLLLDLAGGSWREKLRAQDDLGELVQGRYGLTAPGNLLKQAEERARDYGGAELRSKEMERETKRQDRISGYRRLLVDGPVLTIPLTKPQTTFDPNTLQPLGELGTVYPTLKLIDNWGVLTVKQGALLASDFKKVTVSAPIETQAHPIKGDGWELELKEGWKLREGGRKGDWELVGVGR